MVLVWNMIVNLVDLLCKYGAAAAAQNFFPTSYDTIHTR